MSLIFLIWLCFLLFLQSFVYAFYSLYRSVHTLVSVKWTRAYTSFLYQKRVYIPLCLNIVAYTNFCIVFSNLFAHIDLFPGLLSLCVVNFCLKNFIILQAYCFEVSSSLKIFGLCFIFERVCNWCFGTQDFVQKFLIVLVLQNKRLFSISVSSSIFYLLALLSVILWPYSFSCFLKVSIWRIWKFFFPDFLVSFSKVFYCFWII